MMATFDAVAWLGAEVLSSIGKPIVLGKGLVAALEAAAKDGTLTEMDVPLDGSLDEGSFKDFGKTMMAVAKHGATVLKTTLDEIDFIRFELWLKGKYLDGKTSSSGKVMAMEPAMRAKMDADMLAQGMQDWPELAFTELSLWLCRPVGHDETAGFQYNSPPSSMDGAKVAKKNGQRNFDQVLEKALESGDITQLDTWMMTLSQRCSTSPASPYAGRASNLFNTWWNKAKRLGNARAIAWYCTEYRMSYVGRGLPKESDPELLALASKEAATAATTLKDLKRPVAGTDTSSDVGSETTLSSALMSSVSSPGVSAQLEKMISTTSAVMESVSGLAERLSKLEAGGGGGGSGSGAVPPGSREPPPGGCLICHSLRHRMEKCSKLPRHIKEALKKTPGDDE